MRLILFVQFPKKTNSNATNIPFHSSQLPLYPGHISTVRCWKVAVMSRGSLYDRLAVSRVVSGVVIVKGSVTSGGSSQGIIVEVGIVIVYGRSTRGRGIADIGGSFQTIKVPIIVSSQNAVIGHCEPTYRAWNGQEIRSLWKQALRVPLEIPVSLENSQRWLD